MKQKKSRNTLEKKVNHLMAKEKKREKEGEEMVKASLFLLGILLILVLGAIILENC